MNSATDVVTGGSGGTTWSARLARSRAARAGLWTLGAVLLALTTWQVPGITPQASIDDSWRIALHMAATQGLDFGREILFTYGPLGFLSAPMLVGAATASGSFAFAIVVQVALALVVLRAATRTFGLPLGVVLAFLALGLPLLLSDYGVYLVFFGCIWVLERDEAPSWWWLAPLGGALAAIQLLVKLNGGIVCLVIAALAAWRLPPGRLRAEGILLGSFALTLLLLWLVTGNPIGELPEWLRRSQEVVSGYTDAMALELRSREREYVTAVLLLVGGAALLAPRLRRPSARSVALVLAAALYCFAYLKEGFVRHDGHDAFFFSAFALGLLAFRWQGWARWGAAALLLGAVTALVLSPENTLSSLYRPDTAANAAVTNLRDVVDGGRRSRLIARDRGNARAQLAVSPAELGLLDGRTVDVVPVQTSAIWAYDLRWKPEPLLQWYMAYSADLDRLNAAALADRGAERLLRSATGVVDGKEPAFEAPATYLAMVCHYRELASDARWEVLARTSDRCGRPRTLATVEARAGETVRIPAAPPGELVYATMRFPKPLLGRFESLVFKPVHLPRITLDGTADYRFVTATADGPLVMRLPPSAGFSPFFDGVRSYRTLSVRNVPSPFTIQFAAMPVAGSPWVAPALRSQGRLEPSAVVLGKRRYPIVRKGIAGFVETARRLGTTGLVTGWAADQGRALPAERVVVFAGDRLVAEGEPTQARPDVARVLGSGATAFGYSLPLSLPPGRKPVRVFAIAGDKAAELAYPPGYPWPR